MGEHQKQYTFPKGSFRLTPQDYQTLYQKSVETPEAFWREQAQILDWIRPFQNIKDVSFRKEDFRIRWFYDGTLNVCANCVDRHLKTYPHKIAFIFERNEPGQSQTITYQQLYHNVCRFANVLKKQGLSKGDVVSLYMPMIPEAIYAMLACARLGIIHSVVFAGFSANALAGRLDDCTAEIEAALNTHPQVAESAVIGTPHAIKGQGIYAFILLKAGADALPTLKKELLSCVSHKIGAIAKPDHISIVPALPKTRSGKIMRRVLRKLVTGQREDMGDLSTLADPEGVEKIIPLIEPL